MFLYAIVGIKHALSFASVYVNEARIYFKMTAVHKSDLDMDDHRPRALKLMLRITRCRLQIIKIKGFALPSCSKA